GSGGGRGARHLHATLVSGQGVRAAGAADAGAQRARLNEYSPAGASSTQTRAVQRPGYGRSSHIGTVWVCTINAALVSAEGSATRETTRRSTPAASYHRLTTRRLRPSDRRPSSSVTRRARDRTCPERAAASSHP